MVTTELQQINEHWAEKYPDVTIRFWTNAKGTKHHCQMYAGDRCINFWADTVGELINLGEKFLRESK